jgi:putative aldouronate transport system permease protein
LSNLEKPKLSRKEKIAIVPESILRFAVLFLFILLFIPGVNPARISEKINRNLSLFTSGFFYNMLVSDMGRILSKGWILQSTMILNFIGCLVTNLAAAVCVVGACMSVGNARFRRLGYILSGFGGLVICVGIFLVTQAHTELLTTANLDKAKPMSPMGINLFFAMGILIFCFSALSLIFIRQPRKGEVFHIDASKQLFLMLLPFVVLVAIFSYLPLWGWRYAFFNYVAGDTISMDKFVGFHWFSYFVQSPATQSDLVKVVRNTLAMSGLGILTSWCPMAFAIFLAEIRNNKVRRFIQTLTTVPNFISWVLVYAVAFCIFSTDGFMSSLLVNSGVWTEGKNMLMGADHIWIKMLLWGMWKGLGWSAIMYIAAITGIDQQLYEAATVDGAGRFQKMWHITVPELIPTYMVLLLLSIAGILNNGMEQYFCFYNSTNADPITVLDLWVYRLGIMQGVVPLSTVLGMVKSLISVALLFLANGISKAIRGTSIV